MADRIRHRGPDQDDYYIDADIAMGFRRLSIIDLEGGSQPILNEDGTKVLTFNGEIYNFQDLRRELIDAGHTFKTSTDSEVLLHGYEQWGAGVLQRLRGMYAFVIWDSTAKKLFGARDIFGIKPFYYYQHNGDFFFGSEIKSFLAHPNFVKEVNEERLPEYLCYEYIPNEETMFRHVFKLLNGCYFEYQDGKLSIRRYHEVSYHIDEKPTLEEWERRITETFSESVLAHKIADVEVGCFLSSGVDSSFVVNEVAKGTPHVKSFSVGYAEEKYSELPYAQAFSREIGVPSIANTVDADQFFEANRVIQWYLDEPMPNPAEVPLYFLAQNARRYVKVVLSGEGADELFGGYPMYCQAVHFENYSRRVPGAVRRFLSRAAAAMPEFKGKHFLVRGGMEPWRRYMRANYVFASSADRDQYLKKDYRAPAPETFFKPYFDRVAGLDEPTALQWVDIHTWMLYDILLKADRMSMANSLELRVPFLDRNMLELALSIPRRYRCDEEHTKIALRGAALRQLPESVARRRKLGFPVPLNDWLRQDKYYAMVREKFTGPVAEQFFNVPAICRLLDDHKAGKAKNMTKIWSIYSFILWYELYFVNTAPPAGVYAGRGETGRA